MSRQEEYINGIRLYSDIFEAEVKPPRQNFEYYKKVQKSTTRTVYQDGKKPQTKVETRAYVEKSNNFNQKSNQILATSNYRSNISGSNYNSSNNHRSQFNPQNYSSNSQSYTFNSNKYNKSNYISNSKNNIYLPTRTNNFSNKNQRGYNESHSYNKQKYSFNETVKGRSNYNNSIIEYSNKNGSQVYKSQPKPIVKHERIIIRIQNKRKPRKGEPVENFEYLESKEIGKHNKDSIVVHKRWGDPFYQLIDRSKRYSSLTVGSRGYRYSTEFSLDEYSKGRNRTIDTDSRNQYRFRNNTETNSLNSNKYSSKYTNNIYQTRTTDANKENKYRFNNSTEDRSTNASKYISKYSNNQYQNKTNSSRGTLSSQNYNNYRTQKKNTLTSINYNTQTQGSQSTNYGNYRTLTQNARGTQSTKNFGTYRNDKYNESHKRIQMTQKVDERRRYNSNRGYEGKYSEGAKKTDIIKINEISYINRRKNSNANTTNISIKRSQYDNANKRKSNDSLNGRKNYVIESKRVERKYNNIPTIPNQKRNSEAYKRQIVNVFDTEKYKRRNTPLENKKSIQNISEVKETRRKYTSGGYIPNQNNKSQVDKYKYERVTEKYKEGTKYVPNKYGQDRQQNTNKYERGRSFNQGNYEANKYGRGIDSKEGSYGADKYGRGRDSNSKVDIYNKYKRNIKEVDSKGGVNKSDKYGRGMDTQIRTYESSQYTRTYNRSGTNNEKEADKSGKYGRGIDSQGRTYEENKYVRERGGQFNKENTYNQYRRNTDNEEEVNKYPSGIYSQENTYESNQYVRESNNKEVDNEEEANRPGNYDRSTDSQERTYESNQYVKEYNRRGLDNDKEINRVDKYGRGMDNKERTYGADQYGRGRGMYTNEETYERGIYSKEGIYVSDELGRGRGIDSNMSNQQREELYQKEKMIYSQQVNDDEQQYMNNDPHFCPVHGYHNIYDEDNQFEEDQKEINQYRREDGIEQGYGLNQLSQEELRHRQEAFEQRQREEYLQRQGQYQQNQGLNQRFFNNMRGFEDGEQRYEYVQQQINNTQRNMNVEGQDNSSDNYRFYESKYITSSDDNVNILNKRNYMSNENNINTINYSNAVGRGGGISQEEGIDLSKIYIATKVIPVYSEIIDQQFQNSNCSQTHICNICGNPYDEVQLVNEQYQEQEQEQEQEHVQNQEQEKVQIQGYAYNSSQIQGEIEQQQ